MILPIILSDLFCKLSLLILRRIYRENYSNLSVKSKGLHLKCIKKFIQLSNKIINNWIFFLMGIVAQKKFFQKHLNVQQEHETLINITNH